VSVADAAAATVGTKLTWIRQLEETARMGPQVLVWANWSGFVPVRLMLVMLSEAAPLVLVSVTVCAALAVPTGWLALNWRLAGSSVTPGAIAVPARVTSYGLLAALSVNLRVVPETAPATVGA